MSMFRLKGLAVLIPFLLFAAATCAQQPSAGGQPGSQAGTRPEAGIYIVGALHRLHEQVPGFDYDELGRIIRAIDPHVLLTETRPDELSERTDTPGRPEYPRVIWRYLKTRSDLIALPMEPGREIFDVWVGEASAAFERLDKRDPKGSSYWRSYQTSLSTLLRAHWTGPAQVHDALTDDMARSLYLVRSAVGGKEIENGQERWDAYMLDRAREAVRAHPQRRILVLASYRNRHRFDEALRALPQARVVDMEAWLRR